MGLLQLTELAAFSVLPVFNYLFAHVCPMLLLSLRLKTGSRFAKEIYGAAVQMHEQ